MSVAQGVDEMSVVDFDASAFSNDQFRAHSVVVACFKFLVGVEIGMVASFDPHVEPGVVSPAAAHEILGGQVLFGFAFMHVEHEEQQLFVHFWDDGQVDHFVGGAD